jgi:SAM-dependent methyltransferase
VTGSKEAALGAGSHTYTHGHHESVLRSHRWRTAENSASYLLPHLRPGLTLLDVGCGPGTITRDLAMRLAPGRVVGIDPAEEVVEAARVSLGPPATPVENGPGESTGRHTTLATDPGAGLDAAPAFGAGTGRPARPDPPRFEVTDVAGYAEQYPQARFDVVHAHQVLQHVADPVGTLRTMSGLTVPGGLVAARDADFGATAWWPPLPEFDAWRRLYQTAVRANGGEPDAGRRLLGWARAAGFTDVVATTSAWCFATDEDRAYWGGMWADRIVESSLARQLVDSGLATDEDLRRIGAAWRRWVDDPDGWFAVLHGEIVCRTPA